MDGLAGGLMDGRALHTSHTHFTHAQNNPRIYSKYTARSGTIVSHHTVTDHNH